MTKEQQKLKEAWVTIVNILNETGYDFMYMDQISLVASAIRKEIGIDK